MLKQMQFIADLGNDELWDLILNYEKEKIQSLKNNENE